MKWNGIFKGIINSHLWLMCEKAFSKMFRLLFSVKTLFLRIFTIYQALNVITYVMILVEDFRSSTSLIRYKTNAVMLLLIFNFAARFKWKSFLTANDVPI